MDDLFFAPHLQILIEFLQHAHHRIFLLREMKVSAKFKSPD